MKKILALIALFITGNISAYTITVYNNTNGELSARIYYTGEGVCSQDPKIISRGAKWAKSTGICCSRYVTFEATSGSAKGKIAITQHIEGCKNFSINVRNTADGSLVSELR